MNLQAIPIEAIPIGKALPWQLYARDSSLIFAQGERLSSRQQLEAFREEGVFRDMDEYAPPKARAHGAELQELRSSDIFPPDGIKPQIGERVQLRLTGRNSMSQTYYQSRLVGYIRGQTILLTTPMADGKRIDMIDGDTLECRMLNGSHIHIFDSEVVRTCVSPVHYLHLRYPTLVKMQKLRNAPRVRVNLAATVTGPSGEQENGRIIDLSPDGAQIILPRHVGGNGQSLKISFPASADELKNTLTLTGLIHHVRPLKPSQESGSGSVEQLEYGIAFTNASLEEKLWLKCMVYLHIAEGSLV